MSRPAGAAPAPSVAEHLARVAAERSGEEALVAVDADGGEVTLRWAGLEDRAARLAGALSTRGLGAGDRLGMGLHNSPAFVLAALAAWKLGAVPVPIRWDLPDWELDRLRRVVDATVHLGPGDVSWIEATARAPRPELADAVAPHLNGICSSGSTGTPKVILSGWTGRFDPVLATPMMEMWRPVPRPQTVLVVAPMYHVTGFSSLFGLLAGDRLVLMEKFDARRVVDLVERHGVTTFTATPTMLQRIADLPDIGDRDLSSLDWVLQGAAPMPPSLVHRWIGLIGAERLVMAYGMTEGLGITAIRGDEWLVHPGTVGRGIRGTEIRVLDAGGRPLPVGEVGDVYLRSPSYGGYEYLGDAPPLSAAGGGFESVGDVGFLDEEGYLHLLDRRVDVIITGGANVYPAEVEAALVDHPGIADVAVVGLADPEWGRRVHAIVEPAPAADLSEAGVIAWARSRLAPYKIPKTVELVDAVPRSAATKVNRGALVRERGG